MPILTRSLWQKIRVGLLGAFMLVFIVGVFVVMHTGPALAPVVAEEPSTDGENFGQYLADHYALLSPFFERNRQDLLTQGGPLVIRIFGDLILLNMGISWVLATAASLGFAYFYARRHANIVVAMVYSSWRVGLDTGIFMVSSFGVFGWEQLGIPLPVAVVLGLFILIDIIVQSMLVSSMFETHSSVSTTYYVCFLVVLAAVCALVSGTLVKKRMAILASQFADVPSVTSDLLTATAEKNGQLGQAHASRDDASRTLSDAQTNLDQVKAQQDSLLKAVEEKKNSEGFVYSRIIRIRASGDLVSARDQLKAFLVKFPQGALLSAAQAQLGLINQEITTQAAQQQATMAAAAQAAAQARTDLLARSARGEVPLEEMRHALLGKSRDDIIGLFGKPTITGSERWDYNQKMVLNPLTNQKFGLSVYFSQDAVQSLDYYSGN